MNFQFYGFSVRPTEETDLSLAESWTDDLSKQLGRALDARFWMKKESFLVSYDVPIALFRIEHVTRDQARLHFQAGPQAPAKIILLGITRLVPLIEKALASRGVKVIVLTSHSPAMVTFMQRRLGYTATDQETRDGRAMWKAINERTIG